MQTSALPSPLSVDMKSSINRDDILESGANEWRVRILASIVAGGVRRRVDRRVCILRRPALCLIHTAYDIVGVVYGVLRVRVSPLAIRRFGRPR